MAVYTIKLGKFRKNDFLLNLESNDSMADW